MQTLPPPRPRRREQAQSGITHDGDYRNMPDEDAIRAAWKDRGFTFQGGTCDVGDVWTDQGHDVEEIVTIAAGAIRLRIGDRCVDVGVGDEIVIPIGVDHEIGNIGSTPARILFGYSTRIP
jgi:mannose-6-phosphate isomerase-like protein (cupin superfamily)